ncbi:MAG: rhodanese-like domain-containing protein [Gammaproteobacteria bacterium]|uniref:Rhodanese-like domain-containing protein n=1 Tax=Candidatus Thiopontia autotrophica TaxID=2841688 RepID=A0A8J6TVW3_9GAMM|nr:rhodanese-like domain-containing protein [Candidatus Thiopontia autotrophica]MBL6968829.1 rhodanese-like domain-containing protein [Gammaproteobacteria bacterium]
MEELSTFIFNNWELVAAFVMTLVMLFFNIYGDQLRGFESITPEAAIRLMNEDDTVLLDVRAKDELTKDGQIKGASHIPLNQLKNSLGDLDKHRTHPVIAICRSGQRSGVACSQMKKGGFEKVYNLKGGIRSWKNAGLPVSYK